VGAMSVFFFRLQGTDPGRFPHYDYIFALSPSVVSLKSSAKSMFPFSGADLRQTRRPLERFGD